MFKLTIKVSIEFIEPIKMIVFYIEQYVSTNPYSAIKKI